MAGISVTLNLDELYIDENGTLASVILEHAAAQLLAEFRRGKEYPGLTKRMRDIRDEEIREQLRPIVAEALEAPVQPTNDYGEPRGAAVPLRDHIVAIVRAALKTPDRRPGYSSSKSTIIEAVVKDQVGAALTRELSEDVAAAKADIRARLRENAASVIEKVVAQTVRA